MYFLDSLICYVLLSALLQPYIYVRFVLCAVVLIVKKWRKRWKITFFTLIIW